MGRPYLGDACVTGTEVCVCCLSTTPPALPLLRLGEVLLVPSPPFCSGCPLVVRPPSMFALALWAHVFLCHRSMSEEDKKKVAQILRSAGVRASLGVY